MAELRFTWNDRKEMNNRRKHGVSFDEAKTVFFDERAKLIDDPDHSRDEARFILLGIRYRLRLLLVCHTYRQDDAEVRIISARKATRHEQAQYGR